MFLEKKGLSLSWLPLSSSLPPRRRSISLLLSFCLCSNASLCCSEGFVLIFWRTACLLVLLLSFVASSLGFFFFFYSPFPFSLFPFPFFFPFPLSISPLPPPSFNRMVGIVITAQKLVGEAFFKQNLNSYFVTVTDFLKNRVLAEGVEEDDDEEDDDEEEEKGKGGGRKWKTKRVVVLLDFVYSLCVLSIKMGIPMPKCLDKVVVMDEVLKKYEQSTHVQV